MLDNRGGTANSDGLDILDFQRDDIRRINSGKVLDVLSAACSVIVIVGLSSLAVILCKSVYWGGMK